MHVWTPYVNVVNYTLRSVRQIRDRGGPRLDRVSTIHMQCTCLIVSICESSLAHVRPSVRPSFLPFVRDDHPTERTSFPVELATDAVARLRPALRRPITDRVVRIAVARLNRYYDENA